MSSQVSQTSAAAARRAEEPYIPVEELAQRLDLPLGILLRRIEAGDVPARRVGSEGSGWGLRLSDLGIDPEEAEANEEVEGEDAMSDDRAMSNDPPPPPPGDDRRYSWSPAWNARSGDPRPIDPRSDPTGVESPPGEGGGAIPRPDEPVAILPGRITRYERGTRGPRSEVAGMVIDSRELVSGLLDRWERTLEQRIFIEQRQRFESELNARQNLVKQLQLELQTARAEHAAYAAERDRQQLELEHQIADLHRELAAANDALLRRRPGLFHRR